MSMKYINELVDSNCRSIAEMLKDSIKNGVISFEDLKSSLEQEVKPVPAGGDIYNLTVHTNNLLAKIQQSDDRDMLIIVKKIFRSTKYAAITWYAVTGYDSNPHHLPVSPLAVSVV